MSTAPKGKPETIEEELKHIEQESRMVLPGIQALFGFQLVAVFNQNFKNLLSPAEQKVHLVALFCSVLATIFVMTPAAYHRMVVPGYISKDLVRCGTRYLTLSMIPLLFGTCLDFYIVSKAVTQNTALSVGFMVVIFTLFAYFWFRIPLLKWLSR